MSCELEAQGTFLLVLCANLAHLILPSHIAPGAHPVLSLLFVQVQGIVDKQRWVHVEESDAGSRTFFSNVTCSVHAWCRVYRVVFLQ